MAVQVADSNISAHVLGEHGDSQFVRPTFPFLLPLHSHASQVHWSSVSVAGAPLSTLLTLTRDERQTMATTTKSKAMDIIASKGFTAYGISAAATSICEAIVYNQHQVFPLSHWQEDLQCCLSLPAVWGRSGS